jgi:hypothetical protein
VTKRVIVRVEQRHIDEAIPNNSVKCMIAEAIRSSVPDVTHPHADIQTMRYTDAKGIRRTFLTPASVQAALTRFDAGDEVAPFAFSLPYPIHISKPTPAMVSGALKVKSERSPDTHFVRPRVGGKPTPVLQYGPNGGTRGTRRRFGMRALRINQDGTVAQTGLLGEETK